MQEILRQDHKGRGRWQAGIVFILPFLLFGMAWFMYFSGFWVPEGRTNKGELIVPPGQFQKMELLSERQPFTVGDLEGKWAVVVFGSEQCLDDACHEALYKTRQAHIALGREASRVTRLYVAQTQPRPSAELSDEHPGVQWLKATPDSLNKALYTSHTGQQSIELSSEQSRERWPANYFFIVDPLGNIIMEYRPEQVGGDLLKDMKRLLKASNIG